MISEMPEYIATNKSSAQPVVSIILVSCNRAAALRQTLASLNAVNVPASLPTELLLVDNNSSDETPDIIRTTKFDHLQVRPISEPRRGKSHGINTAMQRARGRAVLFTDDDVRLPPEWIERMSAPILSGEADAVVGGIKLAAHLDRPWMKEIHRAWLASTEHYNADGGNILIGANMAVGSHVIARIPEWDIELGPGQLSAGDDVLFSWQIKEAGFRIVSRLDAKIEHHLDPSRLSRATWLKRAAQEGTQEAYLSWHWLHSALRWSRLRKWKHQAELAWMRLRYAKDCRGTEGCAEWELQLIGEVAFHQRYLRERRRPRNYDFRGLRRRQPDAAGRLSSHLLQPETR